MLKIGSQTKYRKVSFFSGGTRLANFVGERKKSSNSPNPLTIEGDKKYEKKCKHT